MPFVLLALTIVTGIVDAVSFLALGHVFTANMTGNVILLAFATAGLPGVSVARSSVALAAFFVGAVIGGRVVAKPTGDAQLRAACWIFAAEVALVAAAAVIAIGYDTAEQSTQLFALITLTGLAMGMRTAAVRKLGVPDLTTTVLTLTITGLGADSSLAYGANPRWQRRLGSIACLFAGAAAGALLLRHSVFAALLVAAAVAAVATLALAVRRAT